VLSQIVEVPLPRGAVLRQAAVRGAGFAISMLWSRGIATDWGLLAPLTSYIARQRRSQLSLVLEGHGYVATPMGAATLVAGDVVELDQTRHDDEGYGGTPCHVLVIEWEDDDVLGSAFRAAPRISRLTARETRMLREHDDALATTEVEAWIAGLFARLRAIGMRIGPRPEVRGTDSPQLAALYGALGRARAELGTFPSIQELAERAQLSERHARRGLDSLRDDLAMPIDGWRDALSDIRMSVVQQALSMPGLPLTEVARVSGFRSSIALAHAIKARSGQTPGQLAGALRERWG
jgi:AraC-like DNA-binding protein